ncbi:MAG: sigma-70 family RNA polymerase sigma factor [Acidobacteriia bacterium]|nr:sigma-70 family RNA polymerase sigma factor [Terriglobia bacterium]
MPNSPEVEGSIRPDGPGAPRILEPEEFASIRPQLLSLVRRVCPRWLSDQAEDIVQIAMMQVLERSQREGGDFEVSTSYLMRAAHNAAVDEIRRRFRRPEVAESEEPELESREARTPNPHQQVAAREIERAIRACLAALAGPRRTAVTLYLLGYSLLETVELSGWNRKRSEHLTHRGISDLRRCLAAKGLTP